MKAWGGDPGENYQGYEWPESNHGIFVDHEGYVWVGGNGGGDSHALKLTQDGDVVAQFGSANARQAPDGQGLSGTALIRRTSGASRRSSSTNRRTKHTCRTATSIGALP